jgi:DNA-directed RNA polymerase specialized sigma24 family protein
MGPANRKSGARPGISQEQFAGLLLKLGKEPLESGARYEALRTRLIFYFRRKCLDFPEDLADEVLDRLARRLAEGTEIDSLTAFALGIARFVAQEQASKPFQIQVLEDTFFNNIPADSPTESMEERFSGMEHCLNRMTAADVELLEKYYLGDGESLIRARKSISETLKISPESVRQRIFSIRRRMRQCMERHAARIRTKPESSTRG